VVGRSAAVKYDIAWVLDATTNPSLRPPSLARWLAFQLCETPPWFWQRSVAW